MFLLKFIVIFSLNFFHLLMKYKNIKMIQKIKSKISMLNFIFLIFEFAHVVLKDIIFFSNFSM